MKNTLMLILLFIVVLVFLCFISGKLSAQDTKRDSLRRAAFTRDSIKQDSITYNSKIRTMAKWDGRKQKLSPRQTQQFKADVKNSSSDLFKPQKRFVSDTTLLLDSVYVKAFRLAAYEKAMDENAIVPRCIWGSFGIGIGSGSSGTAEIATNFNIELQDKHLITIDGRISPSVLFGTTVVNGSILYGNIFKQHASFFTVSVGLGVENVSYNGWGYSTSNTGIGVPILFQGYFIAGQRAGFGVNAYVNLNTARTTVGIGISFAFGRLTTHEKKQTGK